MQRQFRFPRATIRLYAAILAIAVLLTAAAPIAYAQDDMPDANKAVVTRYFDELAQQNLDVLDEVIAPGYIERVGSTETVYDDLETLKASWTDIFAMMGPFDLQIEDMIAEGDRVVTRYTVSFMDGDVDVTGILISRLEDGKIVESWENIDELTLMTAMGMVAPADPTPEANKEVVRRLVDEVYNQQNLDVVEELFAPNAVEHRFDGDYVAEDHADLQAQIGGVFSGMPDLQLEIDDLIAEGDRVMVRFTQSSEAAGVNVSGVYIVRLEDGRIVEGWDHTDMLTLFAQLGIVELPQEPEMETIAAGFTGPQGILVDPDGNIWVIESGMGGEEAVEWVSPETGQVETAMMGDTARVVRISADGEQTEVAMLPSVFVGTEAIGGARLALLDGELYATVGQWLGDLGPDRLELSASVAHIAADGTTHEAGNTWDIEGEQNPDGHVVDSHPYGLTAGPDGRLWVADAGANTLLAVDVETGEVTLEAVFDGLPSPLPNPLRGNALEMDPVPTAIAFDDEGTAYVSLLPGFPFIPGSTKVVTVDADGNAADFATGLTMLTDLRMGPDGNLYAVQIGVFGEQGPIPNSGAIIRVLEGDASEVVAGGLSFPTSVDFDADGNAYVTTNGVGAPGSGEVVMVHSLVDLPGVPVAEAMQMMMQTMEEAPAP